MSSSGESYDVFISFRGEDTRETFTSHLHSALEHQNIRTYIDYQIHKGEDVGPSLSTAIETSHISVVVFSENYADSKWCLQELVKIMECRERQGHIVLPVFYQIDPSHVRKQQGTYQKAFAKHLRDLNESNKKRKHALISGTRGAFTKHDTDLNESNQEIIAKWRDALTRASKISGWDSRSRIYRDDAQLIQNIVSDVLQMLNQRESTELEGLVGIEKSYEFFELLRKSYTKIGIWGMGGLGKTTTAKALFAKFFLRYDHVCFLGNIREESEKMGLSSLRQKLLFELLKKETVESNCVGSPFTERRLRNKQIFVVLDDVDHDNQLEQLCGPRGELGKNITLIITARDRHVLNGRVDVIWEMKEWGFEESQELFISNAFEERHLQEGYEDLVDRAVHYAGGIPLALKVLGVHLRSRDRDFWDCTLRKLDKYPNSDILKVLKVSYDGLEDTEKKIFLDIAFFHNLQIKGDVIRILDASDLYATSGIQVLKDKALITIGYDDVIRMHDLLKEMGSEIVREECKENPGKRSRLKGKEAYDVLQKNEGTHAVEGILLDLSRIEQLYLSANTFSRMPKLRFIRLYVASGGRSCVVYNDTLLNAFSDELRYLEWNGYPFKSFPPNFCSQFLVEMRMPCSNVKQLWRGKPDLGNLKVFDLSECKLLRELPDFSNALKLEEVHLTCCKSLRAIHPSLLLVNTLTTLRLFGCQKLESLKTEKHFRFLNWFSVYGCSRLEEFSLSSDLILDLDLSKTGVKTLHSTIGRLRMLKQLNLNGLKLLNLPNELSHLISLQRLYLEGCEGLFELPDNIGALSSLFELILNGSNVESLPVSIKHCQKLRNLYLNNCRKLSCLPELPPRLAWLEADNCESLVEVSTLKSFSVQMIGQRLISFKNGMALSESSLLSIMKDTEFAMLSVAFHYVMARARGSVSEDHFDRFEVRFPGVNVPRLFPYRTTKSCMTIELAPKSSHLLGFIYSLVLSSPGGMKDNIAFVECKCADGTDVAYTYILRSTYLNELNSNHVYVWYDPFHSDRILENVRFEFSVTCGGFKEFGAFKEFGVRPIWSYESEFHNFLGQSDLEFELDMYDGLESDMCDDGLESDMCDDGLESDMYDDGLESDMYDDDLESDMYDMYDMESLMYDDKLELDESLQSIFETRRQAILRAIKMRTQI